MCKHCQKHNLCGRAISESVAVSGLWVLPYSCGNYSAVLEHGSYLEQGDVGTMGLEQTENFKYSN